MRKNTNEIVKKPLFNPQTCFQQNNVLFRNLFLMINLCVRILSKYRSNQLSSNSSFNFLTEVGFAQVVKITIFRGEINAIDVISSKLEMTLTVNLNI